MVLTKVRLDAPKKTRVVTTKARTLRRKPKPSLSRQSQLKRRRNRQPRMARRPKRKAADEDAVEAVNAVARAVPKRKRRSKSLSKSPLNNSSRPMGNRQERDNREEEIATPIKIAPIRARRAEKLLIRSPRDVPRLLVTALGDAVAAMADVAVGPEVAGVKTAEDVDEVVTKAEISNKHLASSRSQSKRLKLRKKIDGEYSIYFLTNQK